MPERDVAELGGGFHRVAEMLADIFLPFRRHQHADPIAEFEHQIGGRHDVGVISPHMQHMGRKAGGIGKLCERHADHVGFADENPDVVEVGAILDHPAGFKLAEPRRPLPRLHLPVRR